MNYDIPENIYLARQQVAKELELTKDCKVIADKLKININFVYRVKWNLF